MICKNCGAEIAEGAKFCESCGAKVEVEAQTLKPEDVEEIKPESSNVGTNEETTSSSTSSSSDSGTYSSQTVEHYESSVDGLAEQGNGMKGLSIASMVCGIVSLVCCCAGWFGLLVGIAAVVLGIISIAKNADGKGMAIAGIVTGGLGLILALIMVIAGAASAGLLESLGGGDYQDIIDSIEENF